MISLLAYCAIAMMGILIMPRWSNFPYTLPRQVFVTVAPFLLAGAWLLTDQRLAVDPVFFLPMIAFWFFRSITSKRPDISFETMLQFVGCFTLGVFLAGPEYRTMGLIIITTAATLNGIYAIMQRLFKINLFKFIEASWNPHAACGFTRSATVLGPYLACSFMITIGLVDRISTWFLVPMGIQLYAIYLTDNRASFVAMLAGLVFLFFAADSEGIKDFCLILLVGFTAALLFKIKSLVAADRIQSALERKNFIKIFWFAFQRRILLGMGFNVIKTHVPYIQRELNRISNGKFLDRKNYNAPVMRKVHNDLLQHLLDVGLIGTVITVATIYLGITKTDPYALAVIVAFLAAGLFYTQAYWLPTHCLFWLAFGILAQGSYQQLALPLWSVALWLAVGYLVWLFIVKTMIADMYMYSLRKDGWEKEKTMKALSLCNNSSIFLFDVAVNYSHKNGAHDATVTFFRRAIEHYDGEVTMWALFSNMANAYFYAGSPLLCKIYHEVALSFYPYHKPSVEGIEMVNGILAQVKAQGGSKADD